MKVKAIFYFARIQFKGDLVTASPDVLQVALGSDTEFVLLASDGLWDYMKRSGEGLLDTTAKIISFVVCLNLVKTTISLEFFLLFSAEVVDFVRNQLREHGDVQVRNILWLKKLGAMSAPSNLAPFFLTGSL